MLSSPKSSSPPSPCPRPLLVVLAIVALLAGKGDGTVASKHGALCDFRVRPLGEDRFGIRDPVTLEQTDGVLTRHEVLSNIRCELERMNAGFLCMAYEGLADKRLRVESEGAFVEYA